MSSQRLYETTFIVRPDIETEQVSAVRTKFSDLLTQHKAPQVRWESWGKRKLAYEINRFQKGHYHILSFLDDAAAAPEQSGGCMDSAGGCWP